MKNEHKMSPFKSSIVINILCCHLYPIFYKKEQWSDVQTIQSKHRGIMTDAETITSDEVFKEARFGCRGCGKSPARPSIMLLQLWLSLCGWINVS